MENRKISKILIGFLIALFVLALLIATCVWQNMGRNGDESNAVRIISLVERAQSKYAAEHQGKFAANFDELAKTGRFNEKFSENKVAVRGYIFEMKVEESNNKEPPFFSITADPQTSDSLFRSPQWHFYYDSTLRAIKFTEENRQAKADDPSI